MSQIQEIIISRRAANYWQRHSIMNVSSKIAMHTKIKIAVRPVINAQFGYFQSIRTYQKICFLQEVQFDVPQRFDLLVDTVFGMIHQHRMLLQRLFNGRLLCCTTTGSSAIQSGCLLSHELLVRGHLRYNMSQRVSSICRRINYNQSSHKQMINRRISTYQGSFDILAIHVSKVCGIFFKHVIYWKPQAPNSHSHIAAAGKCRVYVFFLSRATISYRLQNTK